MKILVIGSSGFIGNYMVKKLSALNHSVVGMDIAEPTKKQELEKFILGDVLNSNDVEKAAGGSDAIINLAAMHHDFGIKRDEYFSTNVNGAQNVVNCASKLGINKIIFYSTAGVYGDVETYSTEDTELKPSNDYGESKLDAEKVFFGWSSKDPNRELVIVRPVVIFGPGNYANMYKLIDNIHKKRFFFVGNGDNIKSIAYVENLVDATVFLMDRMKSGIEICNYSDYPQQTIGQTVKIITDSLNCKVPKLKMPLKLVLMIASVSDILAKLTGINFPITANRIKKFNMSTYHKSDKIRKLGFEPSVDLADGLKKMVEWYLDDAQ